MIRPEVLADLRLTRVQQLGIKVTGYADTEYVRKEIAFAYQFFEHRRDWPLVDVTSKPVEETASEVLVLLGHTHTTDPENE